MKIIDELKINEDIICINNKECENRLTEGKIYQAVDGFNRGLHNLYVNIMDDNGVKFTAYVSRFELSSQTKK